MKPTPRWLREQRRLRTRYATAPQKWMTGVDPDTAFGTLRREADLRQRIHAYFFEGAR